MRLSDLIAVLQVAEREHGDCPLALFGAGEAPRMVDDACADVCMLNGVIHVQMCVATTGRLGSGESEADMATIFGRPPPLPDRDPTAPHDEPPNGG